MTTQYSYQIGGYKRPDEPDCQIICPLCAPKSTAEDEKPTYAVIRFYQDDEEVRCPRCRRWYKVITRKLAGMTEQRVMPDARARYIISTEEENDRVRMRSFTGFPGWPLLKKEVITLVWWGPRFMGVANQTGKRWHGMPQRKFNSPFKNAWKITFTIIALLSLYYMYQAISPLAKALVGGDIEVIGLLVLVFILIIMPSVRYALKR